MKKKPDFIIIGASRSGTSSLFRSLIQHPDLAGPKSYGNAKELHYFDNKYERGMSWYLNMVNMLTEQILENMIRLFRVPFLPIIMQTTMYTRSTKTST